MVITLRGCSEKHAIEPCEPIGVTAVGGSDGACRILDDRDAVAIGEIGKRRQIGGQTELVDGHDCLRPLADRPLGRAWIEVVGAGVDVGEDRSGAALPHSIGGGDERHRRHDHLVACGDPAGEQRQVKRTGAVGDRDGLRRTDPLSKGLFELPERGGPGTPNLMR